jgi:type IV secretion system protein VirD4
VRLRAFHPLLRDSPDGVLEVDLVPGRVLQLAFAHHGFEIEAHAEPDGRQRGYLLELLEHDPDFGRRLYSLLLQQLVDLNTRDLPASGQNDVPVLVLLDEFARLGHATVIAQGFSYVAGYGLRLLPVLQSPAQLRAEYGADLAEEIMANCGVEIAFAPKELKVAHDLSERLGTWTYAGRSKSRPALLSSGHWSTTETDQRRPLMLPQELIQMAANRLIILKATMPPVRGEKIVYWKERAFRRRLVAAPAVMPRPASATSPP